MQLGDELLCCIQKQWTEMATQVNLLSYVRWPDQYGFLKIDICQKFSTANIQPTKYSFQGVLKSSMVERTAGKHLCHSRLVSKVTPKGPSLGQHSDGAHTSDVLCLQRLHVTEHSRWWLC